MTGHENNLIRNSTAEFLIFTSTSGEESIEVRYEDETIWLSQKMMAALFDVRIPTINEHLKNIYKSGELTREATMRKFLIVRTEGNRLPPLAAGAAHSVGCPPHFHPAQHLT